MKIIKINRLFNSLPSNILAFTIVATALAGTGKKTLRLKPALQLQHLLR